METFEVTHARRAAAVMIAPTSRAILLCLGLSLASDAGVNEGGYTQCRARAGDLGLTGADFEEYLDWCGLETRELGTANARDLPQLAALPAGIHPRESW